jgi:hypothetical protein
LIDLHPLIQANINLMVSIIDFWGAFTPGYPQRRRQRIAKEPLNGGVTVAFPTPAMRERKAQERQRLETQIAMAIGIYGEKRIREYLSRDHKKP